MKRHRLGSKEIKELNGVVSARYGLTDFFNKNVNVELIEGSFVSVNGEIVFFYFGELIVPTLKLILRGNFLKMVVIDMPAVRFIVNGADVMRPGIKAADGFSKDAVVVIVDENNKKPLAIGLAMFSSGEMMAMERGKVVRNIHHVGDDIWKGNLSHTDSYKQNV
jgi:PUA domain protein